MRADEFGARTPWNIAEGGQNKYGDEFNSFMKQERYPTPPEYPMDTVEEYLRFQETKDESGNGESDWQAETQRSDPSRQTRNAQQLRSNLLRTVVGMVAGSVIIVNSYQASAAARLSASDAGPDAPPEIVEVDETRPQSDLNESGGSDASPSADGGADNAGQQDSPGADNSGGAAPGGTTPGGGNGGENGGGSGGNGAGGAGDGRAPGDETASEDAPPENQNEQTAPVDEQDGDRGGNQSEEQDGDQGSEPDNEQGGGQTDNQSGNQAGGQNGSQNGNQNSSQGGNQGNAQDDGGQDDQPPVVLPEGHTFGAPTETRLDDGTIKLTYTCADCGETFVIYVSVSAEQEG